MGHGVDFGEELAVNHRQIREAAAASVSPQAAVGGPLGPALRRHLELLRRYVLPAVTDGVPDGDRLAASDEVVLSGIERELDDETAAEQGRGRARQAAVLLDLIEVQLSWEDQVLLPLLEAETTWVVLEDLADHARLARQR